jgi:dihydrodipicolinate synthase/N-acetylneuraminate lyase
MEVKWSMSYKTYESDADGRLVIYPALYPPKRRGIVHLFKKLAKLVSPENVKGRLGDRGVQ